MITYLLDTLVNSIKTSLINKLGLDPSTEVDLDDFPQLIDDIPILDSVEELTVTENGTYTGTGGVTYNPVNVNLPLDTKTITSNGTYSASDDSLQGYSSVTVDIDDTNLYRDTTDSTYESVKTLSNCGAFPMLSLTAEINAQQDLHGYDHPWVGGAGKNKYEGSPSFDGYESKERWTLQTEKYNGHDVYKCSAAWGGMYKLIDLEVGTYTFSCMCKTSDSAIVNIFLKVTDQTTAVTNVTNISVGTSTSWTRISGTFNVTTAGTVALRVERSDAGDIYLSEYQVESGSSATSYAPYSNICPISGWDEVNVNVSGINVWDEEWELGEYNTNTGVNYPNNNRIRTKNFIPVLPSTTYYFKCSNASQLLGYDINKNYIGTISHTSNATFTTRNNCYYIKFSPNTEYGTTYNNDISINYPSTDTEYHAYNGQTYTIDLDGTRYGGTLDVVSGELKVVPYYASYNGETLEGEWISDRDVYAVGTTPTIGAQVVNIGATPTTYQLTPTQVKSLLGTNNVWADTGDVGDVRYFKKVEL